MQDFPANSAKARRESQRPPSSDQPEKIERVTSAPAKQRKRGLGKQFKDTFIAGSARGMTEYVVLEVIIPSIKDMIVDGIEGGLQNLIYGDSRRRRSGPPSTPSVYSSNPPQVNYGSFSRAPQTARTLSRQSRARHDFGEIELQSKMEAEDVIDRMYDVLARYGSVPVSTLYALTGIQASHTDEKWGWTSLSGAKAARQRNGSFLLDLPDPEPLDR